MKDFSTDQKMYKKPMTLHVDATSNNYKSIMGDLVDNRMGNVSKTTFDVKMTELKVAELDMQALSMNNISTNATFNGVVEDMQIKAKSDIAVKKVELKMGSNEFINELLAGISSFNVNISLAGDVQKPSVKVVSDLDKQLSKGLSGLAKKAAKGFEKKLTSGIMSKFGGSTGGMSSNLGDLGSMLDGKQNALDGINVSSMTSGGGAGGFMKNLF